MKGSPVDLSRLSISVIGLHYEPETTGNAPYTTAMVKALHHAGADVRVITGVPHYPQWHRIDAKYRGKVRWSEAVDGVQIVRVNHVVPSQPDLIGRAALEGSFLVQALRESYLHCADMILAVTPTLSAPVAGLLTRRRKPLGVVIQDLTGNAAAESGSTSSSLGMLISRFEYSVLRRANRVGVISPRFAATLIKQGVQSSKVDLLANFTHIEPTEISRNEARRQLGWSTDSFTVVHTGNMGRKQGLESVVDAARLLDRYPDQITIVLVGDGNQRRTLQSRAAGIESLTFEEPYDAATYPKVLAAADALLVNERPGVQEMSLPSKLTSYAVAGRPIIGAVERHGITGEVLEQSHAAVLCTPGQPQALVRAIIELNNSPQRARQLGDRGRELYRREYGLEAANLRYQKFAAAVSTEPAPFHQIPTA